MPITVAIDQFYAAFDDLPALKSARLCARTSSACSCCVSATRR